MKTPSPMEVSDRLEDKTKDSFDGLMAEIKRMKVLIVVFGVANNLLLLGIWVLRFLKA